MIIRIRTTLQTEILDCQGRTVCVALKHLGFDGVKDIRIGRLFEIEVDDGIDVEKFIEKLNVECEEHVINPVMEQYKIEVVSNGDAGGGKPAA